ncbi:MAG: hypothetical protein GYA45_04250 [Pelolinea sp.]|nr:hypothetical protein [Pelolinea sp.]
MERKQAVTPIDIQKIKKELEEKRKELLTFLNSPQASEKGNQDNYELAQHYQISEQKNSLNSHNQKLLAQIEDALGKIENGTYGVCDHCGKPIDPDRLKILPYASYCMECLNKFPSKLVYSSSNEER